MVVVVAWTWWPLAVLQYIVSAGERNDVVVVLQGVDRLLLVVASHRRCHRGPRTNHS